MQTEIEIDLENGKKAKLAFTDDGFDISGWLNFFIDDEKIGEVLLSDLMPALIAFEAKFSRNKQKD